MKRIAITLLIAIMTICGSFSVGCKKKFGDAETDLEIVFWKSGAGVDYFERIVEAFKVKHPEINVDVTASEGLMHQSLYSTPNTNTVDLYFTTMEDFLGYSNYLEPIGDLLERKVDGNDITIGDKFDSEIIENTKSSDGTLYSLPWQGGVCGLVYNVDLFTEYGYSEPKTTDELITLADDIVSDGEMTPFIYYAEYWRYLYEVWMAQYDGREAYFNKWRAVYVDETGAKHENDVRAFTTKDGMWEAYKVLYDLIGPRGNAYQGVNSLNFTPIQTLFLNGKSAMMPNGSWLENEMRNTTATIKFRMMKAPVISALGTKLGITDAQLSVIVKSIDGDELTASEQNMLDAIGENVKQKVAEVRNLAYSEISNYHTLIPNYSTAKDAAKEFLAFYFSDEAMRIMVETTKMPAPVTVSGDIDKSAFSDFGANVFDLTENSTFIFKTMTRPINYNGHINLLCHNTPARYLTYSTSSRDFLSVDQFWDLESSYWTEHWPDILKQAGLA